MQLWIEWWKVVACLRPACSRTRSFMWLVVALAGFSVRSDLLGVTSIVRGLGLKGHYYDSLIRFFHSTAIDPDRLAQLWVKIALRVFPSVFRFNGRLVLLGDGIKVSKSGRKMPGLNVSPSAPSGYFMAALGIGDISAPFESNVKSDTGSAFMFGCGYKLSNHLMVEATLTSPRFIKCLAICIIVCII